MRTKFLYVLAAVAVMLLTVWACEEDYGYMPDVQERPTETSAISEIRKLIEGEDGLSLPVLAVRQDSTQTRLQTSRLSYDPYGFQVIWDSLKIFTKGKYKIYWIPLKPDKNIVGYVRTRVNGRKTGRVNTAVFHLMVWGKTENMKAQIVTYIPDNHFLRKGRKASDLGYDVSGTEFSGIKLISTLEGKFVKGHRYQKGKIKFEFRLRGTGNELSDKALLDSLNRKYKVHVSLTNTLKTTRSGFGSEDFGYICPECGGNIDECNCFEVVYCETCHSQVDEYGWCYCCNICGNYPCTCYSDGNDGDDSWKDLEGGTGTGGGGGGGSGGGGGGSQDIQPPLAPKAKKIFRNSVMIDKNWSTLEYLLDKITKDPLGQALYNALVDALDGKKIIFNFGEGTDSWFSYSNGDGITIGQMAAESNRLFHEMWHAYQAYQETTASYGNSLLNQEIEAHYVQYLYLAGLEEFYEDGNPWQAWYTDSPRMRNIKKLSKYIDDKGNLRNNTTSEQLQDGLRETIKAFNEDKNYNNYEYDLTREPLETFKSLRKLMNYK